MSAVVKAISWLVAKIFGDNVLRHVAGKAILSTLFLVVLPILLNNFLYDFIDILMSLMNDVDTTGLDTGTVSYSGLVGWFVSSLRIPECLSVIMSALALRVTFKTIPFIRI